MVNYHIKIFFVGLGDIMKKNRRVGRGGMSGGKKKKRVMGEDGNTFLFMIF